MIKRALRLLDKALIIVSGVLLVAVTATVLLQVTMRYIFNAPTSWSEELATVLFVWLVMLGIPTALRHGQHIKVDVLAELPIRGIRTALRVFGDLAFIAVFATLGYFSLKLMPAAGRQLLTGLSYATGLPISQSFVNWAVPVGSVLAVIFAIEDVFAPHTIAAESDVKSSEEA